MPHDLMHASFFSGVGGLDLGLERAGWRTVSFSEIDPYASAVLAERWPGVPNLGDITDLVQRDAVGVGRGRAVRTRGDDDAAGSIGRDGGQPRWRSAALWSGGFPCQDLSVAGKRAGFAGERSSLAFAFLDLVEQHRPPAILLENVPGLLSSHGGKDFGALLGRLAELGYWWAYRILDAQFFGVPQRRRRVFICALHAGAGFGADSAAAVLSVGTRCDGHSAADDETRPAAARSVERSITAPQLLARDAKGPGHNGADERIIVSPALSTAQRLDQPDLQQYVVGPSPDPGGVREADGLAGRLDDRPVAATLNSGGNSGGFRTEPGEHLIAIGEAAAATTQHGPAEVYLPLGLDSHRYRCCGNGVVSNVAEWIGVRLAYAVQSVGEGAA